MDTTGRLPKRRHAGWPGDGRAVRRSFASRDVQSDRRTRPYIGHYLANLTMVANAAASPSMIGQADIQRSGAFCYAPDLWLSLDRMLERGKSVAKDIGIDLGTATVIVYMRGKGVALVEPSVVARETESGRVLAVGEDARRMIGRTPGNIVATRPLKEGVIADYDATLMMLRYFIERVCGRRRLFRPEVVVCVPSGVTSVEKRAALEACMEAGAKRVYLISEPMAAAIGAGLPVAEPGGNMVVDIGGGTTDVAVISLGGEVVSDSLRVAGDTFDDAIVRYIRKEVGLIVGERTAEDVKIGLGNVYQPDRTKSMEIRGRDAISGLPRTVKITQYQLAEALEEPVRAIVQAVRSVLERTPPELAADIIDEGIVMTGGGALLRGLDRLMETEMGIPARLAEDPVSCVALGTGKVLDDLDRMRQTRVLVSRA